jgi:hypothetical protein
VLIEGAAGIGKTRLLGEARRRAEAAGMRALADARPSSSASSRSAWCASSSSPCSGASAGAPWRALRRPRRRCSRPPPAPTPPTARLPRCTGCTGSRRTSLKRGRWRWSSTTCTGAIARRCASSPYTKQSLVEAHRRGSLFAATASQIFHVAKFFGTQDAVRLRGLKARVDPDGTVVANHPV